MSDAIVKILHEINQISNNLDEKGYIKFANALDSVVSNVISIKQAQYHGVQGTHIENDRCFQNCFRQKRAKDKLNTQESWEACHSEYVESVQNKDSDWHKYAEEDSFYSLEKQASEPVEDFFDKEYKEQASELLSLALDLSERGELEIGSKLASYADGLVKAAQFRGKGRGFFNGLGEGIGNVMRSGFGANKATRQLENLRSALNDAFSAGMSSRQGDPYGRDEYIQKAQNLQDAIRKNLPSFQKVMGDDQNAQSLFQTLNQLTNTNMGQGRLGLIQTALQQINQFMNAANQQPAQQSAQPSQPEVSPEENTRRDQAANSLGEMTDNDKYIAVNDEVGGQNADQASGDLAGMQNAVDEQDRVVIDHILQDDSSRNALLRQLNLGGLAAAASRRFKNIKKAQQMGLFQGNMAVDQIVSKYKQHGNLDALVEYVKQQIQPVDNMAYDSNQTSDVKSVITNGIKSIRDQLNNLPKDQGTHAQVVEAILASGWDDRAAASHMANWLMGARVASQNKLESYFKLG